MSKRLMFLLLAAVLLLTACSSQPAASNKPLPQCSAVVEAVLQSQTFTEEMLTISQAKTMRVLDLPEGSFTDASMAMDASRTTAEAIIAITAADANAAKSIAELLEAYRTDTLLQYKSYRPAEVPKLENAKVLTNGLQCVLMICPDQSKAQTACKNAWK